MIFVVEDEPVLCRSAVAFFAAAGQPAEGFENAEVALAAARSSPPDVVVSDLQLPGMSGLDFLDEVAKLDPAIVRVLVTAHGSVQSAVRAMRAGCYEYLEKPVDLHQLARVIDRALSERRASVELAWLRGGAKTSRGPKMLGDSEAMRLVRRQIEVLARAGPQGPPVLITGETGVGKGLLARAIHTARFAEGAPWIEINCAALPASLIEAELFGYERSAFTDARQAKPGLFEAANGGAIFLDEIGELPLELQAKLLKVVEAGAVRRLGSLRERPVAAAIVTASNANLPALVEAGRFRSDLYHRLAAFTVALPPLRERTGDAVLLARDFLVEVAGRYRRKLLVLTPAAQTRIAACRWPGNVRELRFALERAVMLTPEEATELGPEHLPPADEAPAPSPVATIRADAGGGVHVELPPEGVAFSEVERATLAAALQLAGGNVVRAAALLDMGRDALRYRLRKFGLAADGPAGSEVSLQPMTEKPHAK